MPMRSETHGGEPWSRPAGELGRKGAGHAHAHLATQLGRFGYAL